MAIDLYIDLHWVIYGLLYLLIGTIVTLIFQTHVEKSDRMGFWGCLGTTLFWFPCLFIILAAITSAGGW